MHDRNRVSGVINGGRRRAPRRQGKREARHRSVYRIISAVDPGLTLTRVCSRRFGAWGPSLIASGRGRTRVRSWDEVTGAEAEASLHGEGRMRAPERDEGHRVSREEGGRDGDRARDRARDRGHQRGHGGAVADG